MIILNHSTIQRKIKRLAFQVLEQNFGSERIFLLGINRKGMQFASLIHRELGQLSEKDLILGNIQLSPAEPASHPVHCSIDTARLMDQHIILFDDVANTGRTLFYACRPLLDALPRKLETGVLVDRKHKNFPIQADYVGLSLATTMSDHISVSFQEDSMSVHLE